MGDPDEVHAELLRRAGLRVRNARQAAGMTQQQLADRIGMVRSSVASLECGRQDMTLSRLAAIALILNLGLTALIAPDDLPTPPHDVTIRPVLEVSCRTCGGIVLDVTDSRALAQESRKRHIAAVQGGA